jgi:hypothetical protein
MTSPLDDLLAGRITRDEYLDRTIDEATAHLRGLPAAKLAFIKSELRARVDADPSLIELAKRASG